MDIFGVCLIILIVKELEFKINVTDILYKINYNNKYIERNEKVFISSTK